MKEMTPENAAPQQDVSEVRKVRLAKLAALTAEGRDPFEITTYDRTATAGGIRADYDAYEDKDVSVAGRLMSKRVMGKASFGHIADGDGELQLYFSRDDMGAENYQEFKKLDVRRHHRREGQGVQDKDGRDHRACERVHFAGQIPSAAARKVSRTEGSGAQIPSEVCGSHLQSRSEGDLRQAQQIVSAIREYLDGQGFYEVETPVLGTLAGGANARPFITHHNTLDVDMYLRIATELNLKRCIVGGFDKVYEVGRIFRNEGMDPKHNPEFTTVEVYQAYTDYNGMMDLTENLIRHCAMKACGTLDITYQGEKLSFAGPWERLPMTEAVKRYVGMDFDSEPLVALIAKANAKGLELPADTTWGKALYEVFDNFVEDKLTGPVFITDYPVEVSPLAKKKPTDHRLTERFELFIACKELANAFSELNDPIDQRERFAAQMEAKAKGDEEAQPYDEDFITALEYGMPPTGGMGMGVDRLVMLLTDSYTIREVLLFPTMKPRA